MKQAFGQCPFLTDVPSTRPLEFAVVARSAPTAQPRMNADLAEVADQKPLVNFFLAEGLTHRSLGYHPGL